MEQETQHAVESFRQLYAYVARLQRVGATRTYRVTPLAAAMAAASTSNVLPVTFRRNGIVLGVIGSEAAGTDINYATTEARIQVSGQEDLILTDDSGGFCPFLMLFAQGYYPIFRRVYTGQSWSVTYRNTAAAATVLPSLAFSVLEDPENTR